MLYDWALNITDKYIFINAAIFAKHHVTVAISFCNCKKKKKNKKKKKTRKSGWKGIDYPVVFFRNYVQICVNIVLTTLIIHTITIYFPL